jgi:uncharacterized protein (TIGR03032 family)
VGFLHLRTAPIEYHAGAPRARARRMEHDRTPAEDAPWLDVTASSDLAGWLAAQRVSLAFTTYQTGKLFLLGVNNRGALSVFERTFSRAMGLCGDGQTLWMSSHHQIWRFENALRRGQAHEGHDRLFVPRVAHTTGDLDVHDVARMGERRIVFVVTRFNCLGTLSERLSFTPLWRPPFIKTLAGEDRCHLNGVAVADGAPRYVTACAATDEPDGWRARRRDGGCVIDVASGATVATGLSMPHSPRLHGGELWLHNSGAGLFGRIDLRAGTFEPVASCPGYLRGLCFVGEFAVAGLSRPRRDGALAGLELDERLARGVGADAPMCGLQVIDLRSGRVAHWLALGGMVSELYDVVALPDVVRPMALGFRSDEIARLIAIDLDEGG